MLSPRHGEDRRFSWGALFLSVFLLSSDAEAALSPAYVESVARRMLAAETRAEAIDEMVNHGAGAIQPLANLYTEHESLRAVSGELLLRLANDYPGQAAPAAPALIDLLRGTNHSGRVAAAQVLGIMGPGARAALRDLRNALRSDSGELRMAAASALAGIAEGLQDNARQMSVMDLEQATSDLQRAIHVAEGLFLSDKALVVYTARLRRSADFLALLCETRRDTPARVASDAVRGNPIAFLILAALFLGYAVVFVVFLVRPAALISHGRSGTWPRRLFLVHCLANRPRTLDAWVTQHLGKVRQTIDVRARQEEQDKRIPVPVRMNGLAPANLCAADLRPVFSDHRVRMLIHGEGGVGKTNLAYQLARWATEQDPDHRLCPTRPLLPILLRPASASEERSVKPEDSLLVQSVRHELAELADLELPPPAEWVDRLVNHGRILVIADDLSDASGRLQAELNDPNQASLASMVIVTSRNQEVLYGAQKTTLEPVRLAGNNIDAFVSGYIRSKNKENLFHDTSLKKYCAELRNIAARQSVTVLMAKLYAELIITRRQDNQSKDDGPALMLPTTVPDLMLHYLNYLNRGSESPLPLDHEVHPAAKRIAWECIRRTFTPSSIERREAMDALLGGTAAARLLEHIGEKRLRLLKVDGATRDRLRFSLDPLAEYLAALWLVSNNGRDAVKWDSFLREAAQKRAAVTEVTSFLAAVLDCCETKSPGEVLESIREPLRLIIAG